MKLGRMNHIGVATPDLDASIAFYRDVMGATDITEPFVLESQQVRVCFVNTPTDSGMAPSTTKKTKPAIPVANATGMPATMSSTKTIEMSSMLGPVHTVGTNAKVS